jgi:hypothetical protein
LGILFLVIKRHDLTSLMSISISTSASTSASTFASTSASISAKCLTDSHNLDKGI